MIACSSQCLPRFTLASMAYPSARTFYNFVKAVIHSIAC